MVAQPAPADPLLPLCACLNVGEPENWKVRSFSARELNAKPDQVVMVCKTRIFVNLLVGCFMSMTYWQRQHGRAGIGADPRYVSQPLSLKPLHTGSLIQGVRLIAVSTAWGSGSDDATSLAGEFVVRWLRSKRPVTSQSLYISGALAVCESSVISRSAGCAGVAIVSLPKLIADRALITCRHHQMLLDEFISFSRTVTPLRLLFIITWIYGIISGTG